MRAMVTITLWRLGAGLGCVPRAQQRYVVAARPGDANAWEVWRETSAGRAELVDGHVSAEVSEPGAERADVLRVSTPRDNAAALVDRTLAHYPGCLVAVAPDASGGCVAGARDGTRVVVAPVAPERPRCMTGEERAGFASFLHGQLVTGQRWTTAASGSVVYAVHAVHLARGRTRRAPLWVRVLALTTV